MNQVKRDWKWSDQFIPAIRNIVGPHLLEPASLDVDRHKATDLVVMRAKNLMIACRVRRSEYGKGYATQFTLRSRRASSAKSEFEKITEGWGDWMLYGFAAPSESAQLAQWCLIDLHAFRCHLIQSPQEIAHGEHSNPDGTSFRWFDLKSFPADPPILVASSISSLISKREIINNVA